MKKYTRFFISFLFFFALIFAFSYGSPAYADVSGDAYIVSHLRAGDGTVSDWNAELPCPAVNATNIELAGMSVYCPAGYYVYSVEYNGENITRYATASATGTDLVFPAMVFSINPNDSAPIHITPYEVSFDITYAPVRETEGLTVTYTAGVNELPTSLREQNCFALEDGVHYIRGYGEEFAVETPSGWMSASMTLTYPNGSSVEVSSGQRITPYDSCTVQVVYVLPITIAVHPNLTANYGDPLPQGEDAFTYTVNSNVDSSDISVEAQVYYPSEDVGTHDAILTDIVVRKGDKVFNSCELKLNVYNGWIRIKPAPLTVTADSVEKIYDGQPLNGDGYTVEGLKGDDYVDYIVNNSSITTVGSIDSIITYAAIMNDGRDVSANYEVYYERGVLTVEPCAISVSVKDCVLPYNGYPQTATEYNIGGMLAEGDTVSVNCIGSATYVSDGKVSVTPVSVNVYNENGTDVSSCYTIDLDNSVPGSISIEKRPISVVAGSMAVEYSGYEISAADAEVYISEDTPLAETDELVSAVCSGRLTYVGETTITVSNAKIGSSGSDVSDNYSITYIPGILNVVPAENKGTVKIMLGASKVYDSKELRNAYTWELDELASHSITAISIADTTIGPEVCSRQLNSENAEITLFGEDGITVLNNEDYNIEVCSGVAEITKQTLKITPSDCTKKYDGKTYIGLINRDGTLSGGAFVNVSANTYPYINDIKVDGTAVGTYTLIIDPASVKVTDINGKIINSNFDISFGEAELKVTATASTANYSKTAGGTVTINCSVTPTELLKVSLDDKELVSGKDYVVANGNETVITIVNSTLKNISSGNHTLSLRYEKAGELHTTISVSENGKTSSTALNFSLKK